MTKELSQWVAISSFAIVGSLSVARADEGAVCRAVDLRSEQTAPVRSQIFINDEGTRADSQLCHAFASANLAGQVVGTSVSPLPISFHVLSADVQDEGFGSDIAYTSAFEDALGGADTDLRVAMKSGLCAQASMDAFLRGAAPGTSTLQALYDYVGEHAADRTVDQITAMLDEKCGSAIPLVGFDVATIHVNEQTNVVARNPERAAESLAAIDRVLDEGRFLAMTYDGHVVTVVGRTADCQLLVQDSIPKSWWDAHGRPALFGPLAERGTPVTYVSEHIQAWSRGAVLELIEELVYLSPTAPRTGYARRLVEGSR